MRTKSPTVIFPPDTICVAAIHIIHVSAVEKIIFCPEFKNANDLAILRDDFSYACNAESYNLT